MKSILFFYPHKFSELTDGSHVRAVSLLKYFAARQFSVDMLSFENKSISGSYVLKHKLVKSLTLVDHNPFQIQEEKGLFQRISKGAVAKVNGLSRKKRNSKDALPDYNSDLLNQEAASLYAKDEYGYILVSYAYWSDILDGIGQKKKSRSILDTHDFLTLQQFNHNGSDLNRVGSMFTDEISRVNSFDDVLHISNDEKILFSNFSSSTRHHFIPQFFDTHARDKTKGDFTYDILFIGSANQYNIEGMRWFLDRVSGFLDRTLKIAVAGNICDHLSEEALNITRLGFVENLDELYAQSKCVICPLKRGSGMKIKVIEALSFGVPVVATERGVDGFVNKDPEGGVLVSNDPKSFATYINRLTSDNLYHNEQSVMASALFRKHFSSELNYSKLDKIFV